MQLVMRRYRLEGAPWYNFKINARLVINSEQEAILQKYKLHNVTITPGDIRRDIIRALLMTVPGSFLITAFLVSGGVMMGSPGGLFFIILLVSTFFVYHQIREEVRVKDLLTGRDFKARSFIDLLAKEHAIRQMSVAFANVVDQARTWHEPDVIELEPQPLFPLLEGKRAAA